MTDGPPETGDWRGLTGPRRVVGIVVLLPLGLVLWYLMDRQLGLGADWHYFFYPITQRFLAGETHLYDAASFGWYNPPWLLPLLVPFALLPEQAGLALYRLVGVLITAYCTTRFVPDGSPRLRLIGSALVFAGLATWDTLVAGNVDVLALLGLTLFWQSLPRRAPWLAGLGLVLATLKPQITVLPIIVLLPALWDWPRARRLRVSIVPGLTILASFLIADFDWPIRWWGVISEQSPQAEFRVYNIALPGVLNRLADAQHLQIPGEIVVLPVLLLLAWQIRRTGKPRDRLALSVAATPLILPYLSSQSLVLPLVIAWPRLLERGRYLAAALTYVLQYAILLRGSWGWEAGQWLILFPVALTGALLLRSRYGVPNPLRSGLQQI